MNGLGILDKATREGLCDDMWAGVWSGEKERYVDFCKAGIPDWANSWCKGPEMKVYLTAWYAPRLPSLPQLSGSWPTTAQIQSASILGTSIMVTNKRKEWSPGAEKERLDSFLLYGVKGETPTLSEWLDSCHPHFRFYESMQAYIYVYI